MRMRRTQQLLTFQQEGGSYSSEIGGKKRGKIRGLARPGEEKYRKRACGRLCSFPQMKKIPSSLPICAVLLAAACSSAPLFGDDSHRVKIETVRELKLSGYNQDAEGALQWKLEADSAEADSGGSADIRGALWNLSSLRLSTFDKSGKAFAEMTSPSGRFSPEKKEADSAAEVTLKGAGFLVRGKGWSWSGNGRENLIRVHDDVFVIIEQPDRKLTTCARRMTVRGETDRTTLVFSGNVRVFYGDIAMTCDALEIVVAGSGSGATRLSESERKSSVEEKLERVAGHGKVEIERGKTRLGGDSAEFLPRENLFRVRGNARLDEDGGQIVVRGDEAVGKIEEKFIEVLASRPDASRPSASASVSVEMPSILARGKNGAGSGGAPARTFVSGERMTVETSEEKNVVSLFGGVRVSDEAIRLESETLVVETDPSSGNAPLLDVASADSSSEKPAVRSALAEGGVRVLYEGRELTCARAEVLPPKNLITLTGAPKVVSPEEKSSLSGDRVEVLLDRDVIEVFSSDEDAPERRRVEATLPAFDELSASDRASARKTAADAPAGTLISGDHLTLTRGSDLSTFDIFGNVDLRSAEVSGSCGRLLAYADPKTAPAARGNAKKSPVSQIKKIIASENVKLEQNGCRLEGGRASITPAVTLQEWVKEDRGDADGNSPFFVSVEPDRDTGTRPRITFPGDSSGAALAFALPSEAKERKKSPPPSAPRAGSAPADDFSSPLPLTKKKKAEPKPEPAAEAVPARESYLESDSMEMIAGERRARFFLRGDVIFVTDGGAHGMCDSVEGLLEPPAAAGNAASPARPPFEAKKVICRGKVRLEQDGSQAKGSTLEIFPPENRAALSGNAFFRDREGIELHPGNDRFVFNLTTRELITGAATGDPDAVPAQVSRPRIIIPKGSDRVFVIPKSVRSDSGEGK